LFSGIHFCTVILCFNSCWKSLSKIEDSSYSVFQVQVADTSGDVPNN